MSDPFTRPPTHNRSVHVTPPFMPISEDDDDEPFADEVAAEALGLTAALGLELVVEAAALAGG